MLGIGASRSLAIALQAIEAISLPSILATTTHTNSGRVMLGGPIKQGFTVAAEAFDPGFRYPSDEPPLLFEFSFLAKAHNSSVVGPVHISLVWAKDDGTWALNRMVLDTWFGYQTLF
jgi:hypothetical protein